jgi:hypothetical protein
MRAICLFLLIMVSGVPAACAQAFKPGKPISDTNPQPTKPLCWDGISAYTTCSSGSGGGGGDASAANQATLNNAIGAVSSTPTANTVQDRLKTINTTLGSPFQANGSITNITGTISLPTGAATATNQATANTSLSSIDTKLGGTLTFALPTGAANTTNQVAANASLATMAASIGTTGSTAPTTAQYVAGIGPSGNARGIATDTGGRLVPGQGVVASTRTTLTASTATALESASVSARVGVTVFTEATLTANVYICVTQASSCSPTGYDFLIPNGAAAGTSYTFMFGTTARTYAYSTGTPVLVLNSWTAN